MKQTVEEAAKEARTTSAETLTTYSTHMSLDDFTYLSHDEIAESAFIKGAEWQAKQSPWHEVSEEPKKGEHICVQVGSGNLTSWYAPSNIRKAFEDHNVIRWAYVSDLIKPTPQSINS